MRPGYEEVVVKGYPETLMTLDVIVFLQVCLQCGSVVLPIHQDMHDTFHLGET